MLVLHGIATSRVGSKGEWVKEGTALPGRSGHSPYEAPTTSWPLDEQYYTVGDETGSQGPGAAGVSRRVSSFYEVA